ncbi:MAG: mammalian cell entry protein [Bordetella sp. SCN 67-23]|nr:MCE family protein [Burkholderiales bacterium]ODS74331.1 MAG: mammalian cell entry protein [Bordetella sp. SCN 67-23]ODU92280.1 MAG: mammalian cell entry protein [Bordetella sp. SCN 68-11]OJW89635.1 MAG: mammalian cell entry protein [Burkholderiales bacterium 67-32]
MTNKPDIPPDATPGEPARRRPSRWLPSLVWLIPIVAAIAGLSFAINSWYARGPTIDITFRSAEGIEAGKTKVRYKDVDIGLVKSIELAKDRSHVVVAVELTSNASSFAVEDSRFWVVKPRIAASGVSGLGTLLSGAYIGVDAGRSQEREDSFTGLEVPPIVTADTPGKQFVLHAGDLGSLDIGSPVYFRRVNVGQVVAYDLDQNGKGVTVRVFVRSPYDSFVTTSTRFWHSSGVNLKVDADGLKLQTESISTVLLGGVSFIDSPHLPVGQPAQDDAVFQLAGNQDDALKVDDGPPTSAVMYFEQSVRGLSPGAPVDFRGVVIGAVRSIGIEFRRDTNSFRLPVVVDFYPSRLGLRRSGEPGALNADAERRLMDVLIRRGMRAQLRNGNLLTGQMYIAIDFFKGVPLPASMGRSQGLDEFPTIPGAFDELQGKLADIVDKIGKVPFDTIGRDLTAALAGMRETMASADKLVKRLDGQVAPEIVATMEDARKTLKAAEGTFSADAPMQQDLRRALVELMRTANSLRQLTDYLEENPQSLLRGKPKEER